MTAEQPDPLTELLMRGRPGELTPEVVVELLRRPEWHDRAACRGLDTRTFFPERGDSTDEAKAICSTCAVVEPCRAAAIEGKEHGIWAGRSRGQRAA